MEVLEEKEEEQREEEELKGLEASAELQDVVTKVSGEQVCIPSDAPDFDWSTIDTSQFPSSYKTNSPKEKKLLQMADHFLKQYTYLYPERNPLFLHPVNECGMEKFVSTTVRPTLVPYVELYNWDGCASFVSDYLTMEPLKSPITPPSSLYSPTTILKYQRGNCFDFSVLLCSLLIGAGYDAYCVHGYATREMCTLDETLELCPLLRKPQEVPKEEMKKSSKYTVKPPPDLQYQSELQQEAQKKAETEAVQKSKETEEKIMEVEKPERDPLHGLRVHAWVLVLSGKRDVPKTFFINPFTGRSHSTTDEHFLGIESVWNHRNYWVNMQDCWNGCKDLTFDLGDAVCWEIMLSESNEPLQPLPGAEENEDLSDRDIDDLVEEKKLHMSFDMPLSWVALIQISPRELETRYFQGRKVILYKKAKLEKWAPKLNGNGLVKRLTIYADLDCTEMEVREWFKNRGDMLDMRQVNKQTQLTTDYFSPGHLFHLKAHTYTSLEPETEHTMEFYNEMRADDLQKRVENATEIIEYFMGRDDFLHTRHTEFGKAGEETHLAGTRAGINSRPIVQIKECFHRNLEKPADEDVAERIFLITEQKIHLRYHLKDECFTASTKDLFKAVRDRKAKSMTTTPKMCISYQAGSSEKEEKLLHDYKLLQNLTTEEKWLKRQVRQSEAEVLNILKIRKNEEMAVEFSASNYDTETDEERKQEHEAVKSTKEEQDMDYLAPFLIQLGYKGKMTKEQALHVRHECLAAYKSRLLNKVKIIQARYEKAVEELQEKEQWFQENQSRLSTEEDFLDYCSEAMFRIHITVQRLNRYYKLMARHKYLAFRDKLHMDPRLAEHLGHA
ncbi:DRC7 protein, partial [Piaya cayana]|nr:DRC7 protein [Piaya cayana]